MKEVKLLSAGVAEYINFPDKKPQDPIKELLKEELDTQFLESLKEKEINWVEKVWFDSWDKIKSYSKKRWNAKKPVEDNTKLFLLGHDKDTIKGKPQLIENIQRTIPLIRKAVNKIKDKKTKEDVEIQSFYFFDEKFDKRHDGFQIDAFALDFWTYRIITSEGKEYYLYSQKQLPNQTCTFKGMLVELDDFAELSRSLKIKSVSKIFFVKSFEPDVKILTPEQIVNYAKERQINEEDWFQFLGYHPLGTINRFPDDVEYLKSGWLLSSKVDDYPLHLSIIGTQGTKKSKGHIETTGLKFDDNFPIYEGGNSRLKGLAPSFKEKPANLGYLAKSERVGFIDEIGKMVEQRMNQDNLGGTNLLGELNFLLDHSERLVGSGNDNEVRVKATAKFMFVSNPVKNKPTIYSHIGGVYDPTFMSRLLWWIQDRQERSFLESEQSVIRPSDETYTSIRVIENRKKDIVLKKCYRKVSSREEFLTLYDTCNSFLSAIDSKEVLRISNGITMLAKEPMKSVWKPRAEHHTTLLIDGLVKHRCLFKDYDSSFVAKQEDYLLAERILTRMRKSWDTDFSLQEMKA